MMARDAIHLSVPPRGLRALGKRPFYDLRSGARMVSSRNQPDQEVDSAVFAAGGFGVPLHNDQRPAQTVIASCRFDGKAIMRKSMLRPSNTRFLYSANVPSLSLVTNFPACTKELRALMMLSILASV